MERASVSGLISASGFDLNLAIASGARAGVTQGAAKPKLGQNANINKAHSAPLASPLRILRLQLFVLIAN
jgi:hypothetical protein